MIGIFELIWVWSAQFDSLKHEQIKIYNLHGLAPPSSYASQRCKMSGTWRNLTLTNYGILNIQCLTLSWKFVRTAILQFLRTGTAILVSDEQIAFLLNMCLINVFKEQYCFSCMRGIETFFQYIYSRELKKNLCDFFCILQVTTHDHQLPKNSNVYRIFLKGKKKPQTKSEASKRPAKRTLPSSIF